MKVPPLTNREQKILALVIQAKSNNDMSDLLHTSVKTIEKDLSSIYRKVGVRNRQELIVRYYQDSNFIHS